MMYYAPTSEGVWFLKVRCSCGASMDGSGMTAGVVENTIGLFLAGKHQHHPVTVEVRRHWKRAANTETEIRIVEVT